MVDAQFALPGPSVHESFEIFEKLGWSIKKTNDKYQIQKMSEF